MSRSIFFTLVFALFQCAANAAIIEGDSIDERLLKSNLEITKKLQGVAKDVDMALSGEKTTNAINLTKFTIRNQLSWPDGTGLTYTPHFDLRLRLPNLEKNGR